MSLTNSKATNGISVKTDIKEIRYAFQSKIFINPALDNPKQRITLAFIVKLESLFRSFSPTRRQRHRVTRLFFGCREWGTFIQNHAYIRTQKCLYFYTALGGKHVGLSINMALKIDTFLTLFSELRKRHHLKSSTIGKYGSLPFHKIMQTAKFGNFFSTRSQHQMIGVTKNNVRAKVFYLFHIHRLNSTSRPNRHKSRRSYLTSRGNNIATPCIFIL